jgi:hypothetical protein
MKIVQLLGRGVDGCGVTRFAIEFERFLNDKGIENEVVVVDDKKWSRKKSHTFYNVHHYRFIKDAEHDAALAKIKTADILIVNSLPPRGSDQIVIDRFSAALKSYVGKVVLIQHDHNKMSITRNECLLEACQRADYIFAHATKDSDFARWMNEHVNVSSLFEESPNKQILNFQPGMYFEDVRDKYWLPIEEQDSKIHRWIGRTSPFKGYDLMFKWAKQIRPLGVLTIMEGLEESPAIISVKEKEEFNYYLKSDPDKVDFSKHYGDLPCLCREYKRDDMMLRLAKSGFGYQLSRLEPRFLEHSIEYTHCEIAAIGVTPVFRKSFMSACIHSKTGNPISQDKNSGTIFIPETEEEMKEVVPLISTLMNDNKMREEWRLMAYEYYSQHQHASETYNDILKKIGVV